MKILHYSKDIALAVIILTVLAAMVSFKAAGQDTDKSKKQATVKIKIVDDKNGKTRTIDTTFSLSGTPDEKEIQAYVKQLQGSMDEMNDRMKEFQVYVTVPDSLENELDSLQSQIQVIAKCPDMMQNICKHFRNNGEVFDFSLDLPEPPFPPDFPGNVDIRSFDDGHMRMFSDRNAEQTLGDLLGDIPMSQVKNYSIKETKNGKRIVIDLEDEPLIIHKNKNVIIYRNEPAQPHGEKKMHKVIILDDQDKDKDVNKQ
jgi:hypothetical protein